MVWGGRWEGVQDWEHVYTRGGFIDVWQNQYNIKYINLYIFFKKESSPTPQFKSISSLALSFLYGPTFTSYMTSGKNMALTMRKFVGKMIPLLLNMLCWFVMAFLPRSKGLLISWLQSPSALILEPKKMKSDTISTFPPSIHNEVMGLDIMIFTF